MSRLTIIIPFFHDTSTTAFEETLASVLGFKPEDADVLVANAAGYDDPWNTDAEGVAFLDAPSANPIDVLNAALRCATGEIVHILYPGTEVGENWTAGVLALMDAAPEIGCVVPCVYDRRKSQRIFSLGINYGGGGTLRTIRRSRWPESSSQTIIPHVSAVFFRKSVLRHIGWFDRSFLPQLAYVDAALSVLECRGRIVVDQACRITVRPNLLPAMTPFRWGIQIERLYFRWLGRHFKFRSLGHHFGSYFVDGWRHFPRIKAFRLLLGRCCGLLCCGDLRMLFRRKGVALPEAVEAHKPEILPLIETGLKKTA